MSKQTKGHNRFQDDNVKATRKWKLLFRIKPQFISLYGLPNEDRLLVRFCFQTQKSDGLDGLYRLAYKMVQHSNLILLYNNLTGEKVEVLYKDPSYSPPQRKP